MIQYDEIKNKLNNMRPQLVELRAALDLDRGLAEAAEFLGVTKDTLRNWIKKTDIPAHKMVKLWKFKLSEDVFFICHRFQGLNHLLLLFFP